MSRLTPLEPENMPPRQIDAYEELIANQRGGVRGPFDVGCAARVSSSRFVG